MGSTKYNRIKIVLFEKDITNKQLAEMLEMSPATVSRWCRNVKQPAVEMLFKISRMLEVDVCELLNKNVNPE